MGFSNRALLAGIGLACWSLASGCESESAPTAPAPDTVAVVNGDPITVEDYNVALNEVKQAGKGYFSSPESASRIKRDLLERLIDKRLLLAEAARKRITLDPQVVEGSIQLIEESYPDGGLDEQLASKGIDRERYRRDTEQQLTIQRLLKQEVVDRIAISRKDIQTYYEQHRDRFMRPEEVRVRQIVTRTEEEAEELRKQIQRGASFEQVAKEHSLGPEAVNGGDLGWFPRGRMPPEIEEVAFKLWSGTKVSKVIESPYGFHLFQPVGKRPARELTLEQAQPEIERALLDERTREAERFFIRTLREQASIERDLQRLDRIP